MQRLTHTFFELFRKNSDENLNAKSPIYIAGVSVKFNEIDFHDKISHLAHQVNIIHDDATKLMGSKVIIIIALPENALTKETISNKDKKKFLHQLQKAVKEYKNIILIPGSFSAYEIISANRSVDTKKRKIIENYKTNLTNPHYQKIDEPILYQKRYQQALKIVNRPEFLVYQNSAYILSSQSNKRIKHQKSYPWYSEHRDNPNAIFYPGIDPELETKHVPIMHNKILDVNVVICAEHNIPYSTKILEHPPLIQIIISNTIDIQLNCLFGCLNIHMDYDKGLKIYINKQHPEFSNIDINTIKVFEYQKKQDKVEIDINYFSINLSEESSSHDKLVQKLLCSGLVDSDLTPN